MFTRALWPAIAIIALIGSPAVYVMLTEPALAADARRGVYIDPSPLSSWLPALITVIVLVAARVMLPRRG